MPDLILIGASVRGAAFSALTAGLTPWCADLFYDRDLQASCQGQIIPTASYPHGFATILRTAPDVPWAYTGGVENYPNLVARLEKIRPLWGNHSAVLRAILSPNRLFGCLHAAGIPVADFHFPVAFSQGRGRWLLKPIRGAGGTHIREWTAPMPVRNQHSWYLQEYLDGPSCSAVFVAGHEECTLLGATRQLIGIDWLNALPFQYCGSVGPLRLSNGESRALQHIGSVLASAFHLKGLFGVDYITRGGEIYPVEVNPRYTASVEILERANNCSFFELHRSMFRVKSTQNDLSPRLDDCLGKAILFAGGDVNFPADGPWSAAIKPHYHSARYADIPQSGSRIRAGQPILTIFSAGDGQANCLAALRKRATEVYQYLSDRGGKST